MNSKQFFSNCHDLVVTRWQCTIGHRGRIALIPMPFNPGYRIHPHFNYGDPVPSQCSDPICVVAHDLKGYRPKKPSDVWVAAELLELSPEFAMTVFAASLMDQGLDERTADVRSELLSSFGRERLVLPRSVDNINEWMGATASLLQRFAEH